MSKAVFDVLVAGGGIIGLTTGLQLAQSGRSVAIFDRGNFGQEASWAGAGILAPPQTSPNAGRSIACGPFQSVVWHPFPRNSLNLRD